MRRTRSTSLLALLPLALAAACASPPADTPEASDPAAEAAEIRALLDDFLANAGVRSAHERFWAEDLIYTSSGGTWTDKARILSGMEDEPSGEAEPGPTYWAEDVDVRVYGTTAVVAFRLMIQPPAGSDEAASFNLNTGTLLKRDGEWRVVAWQSTRGADGA